MTAVDEWLRSLGAKVTHEPELALDRIDAVASLANQARQVPIHADIVERYTADLQAGDVFPEIIVRKRPKGDKVIILGGNHRWRAHVAAERTAIPAWVVECDDECALRICYEDNRRHGEPPSKAERLAQAVHLVDIGWKISAAARCTGVDDSSLGRELSTVRTDRRAIDLGVDVQKFSKVARSGRWRLGAIKSDPVFIAAATLAIDAALNSEECYALAADIGKARSEAQALELITNARERFATRIASKGRTRQRGPKPARIQALDGIGVLRALKPLEVVTSCSSQTQRFDLAEQIGQAITHLTGLYRALREAGK